ncbi:MAG: Z1 domain-containing protein [Thermodesulfovibrionales bacterium]|nr:Z1 domain-containing protein [Thermodesulfovibrionales bacterium]
MTTAIKRKIITDGQHTLEVINVLQTEIRAPDSLDAIKEKAFQIIERSVDPIAGPPEQPSDGLLYGLIQSGKTSIITVVAAMAADNGFQCVVILTSDIDLLYEQTLRRIRNALRGLNVLGKNDWKDAQRFKSQLQTPPFVIVCSKNGSKLNSLLEAFKGVRARSFSAMIIDDEADQASLNTLTSKGGDQISRINEVITNFRNFFSVNTYLQVTATPQALFLQRPDHRYRPSFTVLSQPGYGYVGGEKFFGDQSILLRTVDIDEVEQLRTTYQPSPSGIVPMGLKTALYTFLVGATAGIILKKGAGYAFLCHVSINRTDHRHIVSLIDRFKEETYNILQNPSHKEYKRLRDAYDDIAETQSGLPEFEVVVERIKFYLRGANIKLINASSNEEITLDSAYNIFVGGNKLGRGVTIKNLIVSYYGRNPKKPNADTVLQHARMYGYRESDLGITRLFLPERLAEHFRLIHQMESALRELVMKYPEGKFEGLYISSPLEATRRNVLDPNSLGMYVAGRSYNPAYPLRTPEMKENTDWIDNKLADFNDVDSYREVAIDFLIELLDKCIPDSKHGLELWDLRTIKTALEKIKSLQGDRGYLVVRRGRALMTVRHETQGILSGGEESLAPKDAPTLFMYRQNANSKGEVEIWWPQLRFSEGNYVLAFSFNR